VTEDSFVVELAGRRWALPHLPFRIIKSVQPALFKAYSDAAQAGNAALAEEQIDALATATNGDVGGVARYGKIDFDALIAEVVAATGWTWDDTLDGLTIPRLQALRAEWRRRPPVHWLVAAALRYQEPGAASPVRRPSVAELQATLS
jgi:hypothetical protein